MSDTSQGPGWWIASDGKWYSPEQKPGPVTPEPPAEPVAAEPVAPEPVAAEPSPVAPAEVVPVTPAPVTPPPFAPETPPVTVEPPTEPIPLTPPPMASPGLTPPPYAPPMGAAPPAAPPGTPPPMMTPPAAGYVVPPPGAAPEKKGNGCLKAVLIACVVVFVLGVGTFIALAFLVNKGVDTVNSKLDAQKKVEQRTGISSNSFNTEHPPQDDLAGDWKCSTNSGGFPQVTGTVKNNSSHASTYTITVEFKQNGNQFTTGSGIVVSVDPGQTADFSATGAVEPSGQFTCKIDSIDRFDTSAAAGN